MTSRYIEHDNKLGQRMATIVKIYDVLANGFSFAVLVISGHIVLGPDGTFNVTEKGREALRKVQYPVPSTPPET